MARISKSYKRPIPCREPYDSVLIVCEGSKSEPNYLNGLRISHQLSTAKIRITPAGGSDPMSVVLFAEEEARKASKQKNPYDRVYCVFDRDKHENYSEAKNRINNSQDGKNGKFIAITSWPCFEIWILLHWVYSTAPFDITEGRSACDNVIKKIKENFPSYNKSNANLYAILEANTEKAIVYAKRLEVHNKKTNTYNPSTQLHHLVEYLCKLKS